MVSIAVALFIVAGLVVLYVHDKKRTSERPADNDADSEFTHLFVAAAISALVAQGFLTRETADQMDFASIEDVKDYVVSHNVVDAASWASVEETAYAHVQHLDPGMPDVPFKGLGLDGLDG